MSSKLIAFLAATYLAAFVHAEAGWFCGQYSEDHSSLSACSSDDVVTGFDLPANYKSGDCFDNTAERSRKVACLDPDLTDETGAMTIVDDSVCAAASAKPALTISSTVCVYDWACTTDDKTFHTCTQGDFYHQCKPENPEVTECFRGKYTRTVKCVNQSGVEAQGKCTKEQPATTDSDCWERSGCVYKWYCDSPALWIEPEQHCAGDDTTTGFPETPTCYEYEFSSKSVSRKVNCLGYLNSGGGYVMGNDWQCTGTKPNTTRDLPACGEWTEVPGECVWNGYSCNGGFTQATYTCNAPQGCRGSQPDPIKKPCTTTSDYCFYDFACAPTAETPIEDRPSCVIGDTVGFILPEEGTCVDTVPTRDVQCRAAVMDGDEVRWYMGLAMEDCAIDPMLEPSSTYPEAVCRYSWMCSTDGGDSHTPCEYGEFTCVNDDPNVSATKCYHGVQSREVGCFTQHMVPSDGKCSDAAPHATNGGCAVTDGCERKWVCSTNNTPPETMPTEACTVDDTTIGFPATPTCSEDGSGVYREVGCYYALDGVVMPDTAEGACSQHKPSTSKDLPECAEWTITTGECVWDEKSCNSGIAEVTSHCPESYGCVTPKPEPTKACTTTVDHCAYSYVCAASASTDPAQYAVCTYGDKVGFVLPTSGCVDEVAPRDVACLQTILDDTTTVATTLVDMASCSASAVQAPNAVYDKTDVICDYDWKCSADGITFATCDASQFSCQASDPAVTASKCFSGQLKRTVKCLSEDDRVVANSKCSGAAPVATNGVCTVNDGCERKWVCSHPAQTPVAMPAQACAVDDFTGFVSTCSEVPHMTVYRAVGCYYALNGVMMRDETKGACSQPEPPLTRLLSQCAQWTKVTGECVWDRNSCNSGNAKVTWTCDADHGCVANTPASFAEACTTTVDHCAYSYVCAASASTDPAQYAACTYGDKVGFVLPASGCVDEVAPRDVACLQTILDDTTTVATTLVDMASCSASAVQAPNAVYDKTDVICDYDWKCSADGITFATCDASQFSCQASDPAVTASKCFSGQLKRTVKCLSEDDRVVANSKCSGAAPAATDSECTDKSGCRGVLVCLPTGSAALDTMPTEACATNDVTTGFPATPTCYEGAPQPLFRDVRCYYAFNGEVTYDENGTYCNAVRPPTTKTPPECKAWTLKTGECVWNGDMDTCTIGTRTNTYVCAQGEGKCVANKPADVTAACTFPSSQCGFRYVCAPADATTDDILDMTTAELSCAGDKHFAFDATACYKDKEFTRKVVCFDAKNEVFSTNAVEDCKDVQAPIDRVTRTDEQQCRADAYCAPSEDADESVWAKCLDEQGNSVASTFGPCTVDCSSATQTRAVRCVNELGSVLPNTSCDMDDIALEQYCAAPAQVSQVSVSSDTLTVGTEVEVQWCYYDGKIPSQEPVPTATATTATVTLSSASKKFFATVVATAAAKDGSVEFDVPVVAPAADAVLTVTIGTLHSDSALFTVQSRCTADETYCGTHGTCSDATSACTCTDGFTGMHCDVSPCNKCDGSFSHTVYCADSGAQAGVCVCEPGYEGTACEVKTDCKTTKQCQHGGFVGTGNDGVCAEVCTCSNKWTGTTCNTCDNFCTGAANGKPDAACQACMCTRGYSGSACQCQQAYGTLVFAGAPVTTLQNNQWLAALQRAIRAVTGLSEDAVEVSAAAANKGIVVVALTACPLQPKGAFHTHAVLDTTALYAKWELVVADLKADTSVLQRGVLADLGAGVTATATEAMYDPTCTGDACAKGKDPLENPDNAAAAAVLSAATVTALVFLALIF